MNIGNPRSALRPDPRIERSEAAIKGAVLDDICHGTDFDALTVSRIAGQAGVTRKTLYARFGSLEQVVEALVDDLFREVSARIDDRMLALPFRDGRLALAVFQACDAHRDTLAPLLERCPAALFIEPMSRVASELLDRATAVNALPAVDEATRSYLLGALASVTHGVLTVWAGRRYAEPPEQVAAFIDSLFADGLNRILAAGMEDAEPDAAERCVDTESAGGIRA